MDRLDRRLEIATEIAWQAGRLTLRYFRSALEVETKSDATPVTVADRETERFLVDALARHFPHDAFLGEEHGERPGTSGFRWILDPIDGTKSFVQGVPLYSVLVGLEDPNGEAVLGVIVFPALDELLAAASGEGCRLNGRRCHVSDVASLGDACLVHTGAECFEMTGLEDAERALARRVRVVRGWGDAYGHALVATGRADVMLDPVLAVWDTAPLLPIVEESGGTFTDWVGRRTIHGASGVSTNALLADEVRAILRAHPTRTSSP